MTNQVNKNNQQIIADDWQPDQAVVFSQPESLAKQQLSKVKASSAVESADPNINSSQLKSLQNIAGRLALLASELQQIIQGTVQVAKPSQIITDSSIKEPVKAETVVEGYFDGEQMIAANGQVYAVPANYASKSKLVEGDGLKLTIGNHGHFIYKQINVIDRRRLVANLEQAPDGNYYAVYEHQRWRLLKASVSYFRAQPGDRIAILIPQDIAANFAALENLVAE